MDGKFKIMMADRNSRVLDLLCRELTGEGYQILTAKNGRELLRSIEEMESPDLLILDVDLAFVSGLEVLERLEGQNQTLPVIIHTYHTEFASHPLLQSVAAIIEKTGNHVDRLKIVIDEILRRFYPGRFAVEEETREGKNESRHKDSGKQKKGLRQSPSLIPGKHETNG